MGERKERTRDNEQHDSETDYENPNLQLTIGRIRQLKPLMHIPHTKLNFDLDPEERSIIARADSMTREQVWDLLEKKRYEDLKRRAVQLSGEMLAKARCPVCTLMPPCKHYQSSDEIATDAQKVINQPEFKKAIPAVKRDNLIQ